MPAVRVVKRDEMRGLAAGRGVLSKGIRVGLCLFHYHALDRGLLAAEKKQGRRGSKQLRQFMRTKNGRKQRGYLDEGTGRFNGREYRADFYDQGGQIGERHRDHLPPLNLDMFFEAQMPASPEPYCGDDRDGWKVYSYGLEPDQDHVDHEGSAEGSDSDEHSYLVKVWHRIRRARMHRKTEDPTFSAVWKAVAAQSEQQDAYNGGPPVEVEGPLGRDTALRYVPQTPADALLQRQLLPSNPINYEILEATRHHGIFTQSHAPSSPQSP